MLQKLDLKAELFVVGVVSILALVLRLWSITSKEFWYDEAYTGILVNLPYKDFLELFKFDVHPPVYITLLRFWVGVFGNSDFTIRSFSIFTGVLLIPVSYLLVKNLNISKMYPYLKLVIPLIFAVNPFFVEYSKEARSYSLTALVFSLLFMSFYASAKFTKFNLKWILTALLTAAAFLTHYLLAPGIISLYLFDLLYTNRPKISFWKFLTQKFWIYAGVLLVSGSIIGLYIPTLLTQFQNAPNLWWIPYVGPQRLMDSLYIFLFGVHSSELGVPPALQITSWLSVENAGFVIFSLFTLGLGAALAKKSSFQNKRDLILLIFCSVIPVVSTLALQLSGKRIYLERYLIAYTVFFIILSFLLVFKLKRIFKYTFVGVYIITSLYLVLNISYQSMGFAKLRDELLKVSEPGTQLIVTDPISFTVAKYYLSSNPNIKVRIYNPKENYNDWEMITKVDVLNNYAQLKGKQRLFVYNNSDKPDIWYRQSANLNKLYVYSTLPIFENNLSLKPN